MFDLTGQTALVTGASGGIGGAIARALHRQGAEVTLAGTRRTVLATLADELGERAHIAVCDLAPPDAADDLVKQAEETRPVTEPPHRAQHLATRVLERQVEVGGYPRRRRDHLYQPRPEFGGLQIADPDPVDAFASGQVGQHVLEQPQVARSLP